VENSKKKRVNYERKKPRVREINTRPGDWDRKFSFYF